MSWRDRARPIVDRVLQENHGKSEKEIRTALREAYPFGTKQHHPYKIWLDEIDRQMHPRNHLKPFSTIEPNPNQTVLFPVIS